MISDNQLFCSSQIAFLVMESFWMYRLLLQGQCCLNCEIVLLAFLLNLMSIDGRRNDKNSSVERFLPFSSNMYDRYSKDISSLGRIVDTKLDKDACEYHAAPINLMQLQVWGSRDSWNTKVHEEAQSKIINFNASFTEVESRD